MFDAKEVKDKCVSWIKEWFDNNGQGCNAIVGISGGKDSSVVAALCVEALGADRVIGVLMPDGEQSDIDYSKMLCKHLGIKSIVVNIYDVTYNIRRLVSNALNGKWSEQSATNMPARVRMVTLYAVSQTCNGRVANTCNLSEDWIGYATRYGDSVGDFSPLANMTTEEVVAVGEECGLPHELTRKVPIDGLCGKTDEENLGFTYEILNKYIRTGVCEDLEVKKKIDMMHRKNLFKLQKMPSFSLDENI